MKLNVLGQGKEEQIEASLVRIVEVIVPRERIMFGPATFPFALFSFVFDSDYTIFGENWSGKVNSGEGVLILKGERVYTEYKLKKNVRAIQVLFHLSLNNQTALSVFPRFVQTGDETRALQDSLSDCFRAYKRNHIALAEQEFMSFLIELMKLQTKRGIQKYSRHVQLAMDYIKNRIHRKLTRSEIAEACGINETYLSTIFHKETGITLVKFINYAKIEKAKELIHSSTKNMTEIAKEFDLDVFEFSRLFKKVTGVSPNRYTELS
jgi:YesN/AraC family two-component response regulator